MHAQIHVKKSRKRTCDDVNLNHGPRGRTDAIVLLLLLLPRETIT